MLEIIQTFYNLIGITLAQSLVYALIALGIMIPFRMLRFPDLTSEGSFPLGGAVCAALLVLEVDPILALLAAILAGFAVGCVTAFIHLRFHIHTLLAGILVLTMLYSVNLRIMGRPNVATFDRDNFFAMVSRGITDNENWAYEPNFKIIVVGVFLVILAAIFLWFLNTEMGMGLRAVGSNPTMAAAQGINIWTYTLIGMGLGNALNALSGAIIVQSQGFSDVNMGFGILINGLAALMLGEAITGRKTVWRQLSAPFVGSIVYYQLRSLGLSLGLQPSDLKLATGLFVLFVLALPTLRKRPSGFMKADKVRET